MPSFSSTPCSLTTAARSATCGTSPCAEFRSKAPSPAGVPTGAPPAHGLASATVAASAAFPAQRTSTARGCARCGASRAWQRNPGRACVRARSPLRPAAPDADARLAPTAAHAATHAIASQPGRAARRARGRGRTPGSCGRAPPRADSRAQCARFVAARIPVCAPRRSPCIKVRARFPLSTSEEACRYVSWRGRCIPRARGGRRAPPAMEGTAPCLPSLSPRLQAAAGARGELLLALLRRRCASAAAAGGGSGRDRSATESAAAGSAFWSSAMSLLFLSPPPSQRSLACDDMLFFVPVDAVEGESEPFFVRRCGPKLPPLPDALLRTGVAAAVDWRASLLLNLVCHASYRVNARAVSVGDAAESGQGTRAGAEARGCDRAGSAEAHCSPSFVIAGAEPTPVYPHHVCYSVGGAEDAFDAVVLRGSGDVAHVELHATDSAFAVAGAASGGAGPGAIPDSGTAACKRRVLRASTELR